MKGLAPCCNLEKSCILQGRIFCYRSIRPQHTTESLDFPPRTTDAQRGNSFTVENSLPLPNF